MRWAVKIVKTSLDKRSLQDLLGGLGFTLKIDEDALSFSSSKFDSCVSSEDAFKIAKELRNAFTLIDEDFTIGNVLDHSYDPPRCHYLLEVEGGSHTLTSSNVNLSISPPDNLKGQMLKKWKEEHEEMDYQTKLERQRSILEPAFKSDEAAKVIKLLADKSPSSVTLYKIYEHMEASAKRKKFQKRYGIEMEEFNRFKDAIHNPKVTGAWARHAREEKIKSANPMTKKEAEQFVRQLASKWLDDIRKSKK